MSKTTEYITKYIAQNNLMEEKVASDTGVSESKLILGTKEKLDAAEFLCLCEYLGIRPENIR